MSDPATLSEPMDAGSRRGSGEVFEHPFGGGDDDDDDDDDGSELDLGGGLGGGSAGPLSGASEEGAVQLLPDTDDSEADVSSDDDDAKTLSDRARRARERKHRAQRRARADARAARDERRFAEYLAELEKQRPVLATQFPLCDAPNAEPSEYLTLNEYAGVAPTKSDGLFRPLFVCLPSPKSRLSSVLASFLLHRYQLPSVADVASPLFPDLAHIKRALPSAPLRIYGRGQAETIERKVFIPIERRSRRNSQADAASAEEPEAPKEKIEAPPMFLLTSDLLLSTVSCSSTSLLYGALASLLHQFAAKHAVSHIFLFSSLPITLSFSLKGGASDVTKKELERLIKRATKIGHEEEEKEMNEMTSEEGTGAAAAPVSGAEDAAASKPLSVATSTKVKEATGGGKAEEAKAGKGTVAKKPSPHFKPRAGFLKRGSRKRLTDDDDEDDDRDPEDRADDEAEKVFLNKQLKSFLFYASAADDAKRLHAAGGRLISNALFSGLISEFFSRSMRPSVVPAAVEEAARPAVVLLAAYYNPLLSDLFAAVKVAQTLNTYIGALPDSMKGAAPMRIALGELKEKANLVSKKIKKALLKSIAQTADSARPSSMYM